MSVENTLKERGARYGAFEEHAAIAQAIQDAFRTYPEKWSRLPPVIKQGFTTLADKCARVLNGDEFYDDNYHDIGGYAKLMEDWVIKENNKPEQYDFTEISEIILEHTCCFMATEPESQLTLFDS